MYGFAWPNKRRKNGHADVAYETPPLRPELA
jgi:hypothetical protein